MGRPELAIKSIGCPIQPLHSEPTPVPKKRDTSCYKDNIGLNGKIIENYEEKVRVASIDPFVRFILESDKPEEVSDTIKYYAQNPTINMIQQNPELFLVPPKTTLQNNKLDIAERYSNCKCEEDLMNLIINANTIEDCNYIINKLEDKKGSGAIKMKEIAKIKANFLAEQLQKESIEKKAAEASKAYATPQIYMTDKK